MLPVSRGGWRRTGRCEKERDRERGREGERERGREAGGVREEREGQWNKERVVLKEEGGCEQRGHFRTC